MDLRFGQQVELPELLGRLTARQDRQLANAVHRYEASISRDRS